MKLFRTLCILWLSVALPALAGDDAGKVGLSVVQDSHSKVECEIGPEFEINPPISVNFSHAYDVEGVTSVVNQANVGKQVLDYLLQYDMESMRISRLDSRIPASRRAAPTLEDRIAAVESNYVLVVRPDDAVRDSAAMARLKTSKPKGRWYLYQLSLPKNTAEQLEANFMLPGDSPEVRGMKRFNYDRMVIVLQLVASGSDLGPSMMKQVRRHARCVTVRDVQRRLQVRSEHKAGKVARVALAPLIIVK